jgi:hypothetical protein
MGSRIRGQVQGAILESAKQLGLKSIISTLCKSNINMSNSGNRHSHILKERGTRQVPGLERVIITVVIIRHWFYTLEVKGPLVGDQVQDAISESAKQLGLKSKKMVSRAYHDSLFMAQVAPTGMIFIPCRGGWSHRPDEYASPSDIENGVKALALTLARLAGSAPADKSEL